MKKRRLILPLFALMFGLSAGQIQSHSFSFNSRVLNAETLVDEETNVYYDTFGEGDFNAETITWLMADNNISMTQYSGNGAAVNSSYSSAARVYKGNYLDFQATAGYKIKKIEITYTGSYKGNHMVAGTAISETTVTSDTTNLTATWRTGNDGTHTVTAKSDSGLERIYIQNGTNEKTQLRWASGGVKVTYIKPAASGTIDSITVDGPNAVDGVITLTSGILGLTRVKLTHTLTKSGVVSTAVTWTSSNSSILSVDENGLVTVLANTADGVDITVTADADDTKSATIKIKASGLQASSSFTNEETEFTTEKYGENNIAPLDTSTTDYPSSGLSSVSLKTQQNSGAYTAGFYKDPESLRLYSNSDLVVKSDASHYISFIVFDFVFDYEVTAANTSYDNGTGNIDGTKLYLDLTSGDFTTVTLSFTAQVRFSAISVYLEEINDPALIAKLAVDDLDTKASLSYKYGTYQRYSTTYQAVAADMYDSNDNGSDISNVSQTTDVSITFSKKDSQNAPNQNAPKYYDTDKTFRTYNGNNLTIASTNYTISQIVFEGSFSGNVDDDNGTLSSNTWTGSSNSISFSISGTSKLTSISVTYDKDSGSGVSTTVYEYGSVGIRFGGLVEQAIWSNLSNVTGYGVFVASKTNFENARYGAETSIEEIFDATLDIGTLEETLVYLTGCKVYNVTVSGNTPRAADSDDFFNPAEASYIWNAYVEIPTTNLTDYVCAQAYVIVDGDYVFMSQKETSVAKMAYDYINTYNVSEDAYGGSLKNLADMYTA